VDFGGPSSLVTGVFGQYCLREARMLGPQVRLLPRRGSGWMVTALTKRPRKGLFDAIRGFSPDFFKGVPLFSGIVN
jgi:hypothetical protein